MRYGLHVSYLSHVILGLLVQMQYPVTLTTQVSTTVTLDHRLGLNIIMVIMVIAVDLNTIMVIAVDLGGNRRIRVATSLTPSICPLQKICIPVESLNNKDTILEVLTS